MAYLVLSLRTVLSVAAVLLGLAALLPGRAAEEAKEPVFVVETADGGRVAGPLRRLGPDWAVSVGEGKRVAGADVLALRRKGKPLPPLPTDEHLILVNGDRIPVAEAPRLAGERLHFRHPALADGKEVSMPLGALAVYWRAVPDKAAHPERLRRRLAAAPRKRDTILLRNGDVVEGVLDALDDKTAAVEVDKRKSSVRVSQVAAVALNTDLADALRPKGVYARVVLAGPGGAAGARLSLASAASDGRTLTGTTVFGAALRVPLAQVVALSLYQGRAVYLSDLKYAKYEYRPYLDASWPLAPDANVCGGDLRVGGSTYDKGLGMHSHSRVTYALGGAYRRFEAVVGLDDRCGIRGSVRVRVLADGKALDLGRPRELTARGGPLAVGVGVGGVKELTLEVAFGAGGDVEDVVNWADARLVK